MTAEAKEDVLSKTPGLKNQPVTEWAVAPDNRANLNSLYRDIAAAAGGDTGVMSYWGSAGDALPIVCADNLVMVDDSSFCAGDDVYHEAVELAERTPGVPVGLEDPAAGIGEAALGDYRGTVGALSGIKLGYYEKLGFQPVGVPSVLPHILGSLGILGISPGGITVSSENGQHVLEFLLDGKKKKVTFIQADLSVDQGKQDAASRIKVIAAGSPKPLKAFVKADSNNVNRDLLNYLDPEVIVLDSSKVEGIGEKFDVANLQKRGYGGIKFGYSQKPEMIRIARARRVP